MTLNFISLARLWSLNSRVLSHCLPSMSIWICENLHLNVQNWLLHRASQSGFTCEFSLLVNGVLLLLKSKNQGSSLTSLLSTSPISSPEANPVSCTAGTYPESYHFSSPLTPPSCSQHSPAYQNNFHFTPCSMIFQTVMANPIKTWVWTCHLPLLITLQWPPSSLRFRYYEAASPCLIWTTRVSLTSHMISFAAALPLLTVRWRTCPLAGTTALQSHFHLGAFVRALPSVCDDFSSVSYMACYLLRRVYKSFFFFFSLGPYRQNYIKFCFFISLLQISLSYFIFLHRVYCLIYCIVYLYAVVCLLSLEC